MSKGIIEINLPESIRKGFEDYVNGEEIAGQNHYRDYGYVGHAVATELFHLLIAEREHQEVKKLLKIIKDRSEGKKFSALLVRGGAQDAENEILPAPYNVKGFDYENDPYARGKTGFTSEWFEQALGMLLGYSLFVDPHDHGGNKPSQITCPRKDQLEKAKTPSSVTTGEFSWHIEALHENPLPTKGKVLQHLKDIGLDLKSFAEKMGRSTGSVIESIMEARNKRVNGLILSAIKNKETPTNILTSDELEVALLAKFKKSGLGKIAALNVAFFAGSSELKNEGKIGFIGNMIELDAKGKIKELRLNVNEGRMMYTGNDEAGQKLFDEFYSFLKNEKIGHDILLQRGDYLIMNNQSVVHRRDDYAAADFEEPKDAGLFREIRRLVRQYLSEPEAKKSFVNALGEGEKAMLRGVR